MPAYYFISFNLVTTAGFDKRTVTQDLMLLLVAQQGTFDPELSFVVWTIWWDDALGIISNKGVVYHFQV